MHSLSVSDVLAGPAWLKKMQKEAGLACTVDFRFFSLVLAVMWRAGPI